MLIIKQGYYYYITNEYLATYTGKNTNKLTKVTLKQFIEKGYFKKYNKYCVNDIKVNRGKFTVYEEDILNPNEMSNRLLFVINNIGNLALRNI